MRLLWFLTLVLFFFVGCGTKEYTLFQDKKVQVENSKKETTLLKTMFPPKSDRIKKLQPIVASEVPVSFHYVSKILPSDKLKIDIYNHSRKLSFGDAVEARQENTSRKTDEYLVDLDGSIYLPLMGIVKMQGKTEKEAGQYLTERFRAFLKEPFVKVSIINTRIYVLGEINKPGVVPIPPSGISLFEVVALSGDFTDHAKRTMINIISGPLGKQTIRTIDMTHLSSINASNMMIRPNSIVYVPPRYMKSVKVTIDDYMPILSLITSTLGTYLSIDYITNGRK